MALPKIEIGQRWKNRDGEIVRIIEFNDKISYGDATYAARYVIVETDGHWLVWGDGSRAGFTSFQSESRFDLIELLSDGVPEHEQLDLFSERL